MGITSGTAALRRRLLVCITLLFAIFLAGLTMPGPPQLPSIANVTAAGPSTTSTVSTASPAVPSPSTAPIAPNPSTPGDAVAQRTTTAPASGSAGPATPPAPTAATPAPADNCGGTPISKAGGGTWTCTFDDEFNGTAVDPTKWRIQETSWNGFHSGAECFMSSPNNVSVSGGSLHLTVRKERSNFTCNDPQHPYNTQWTSGMVTTYGKFTQAYGRFEIRAKLPAAKVKGLQTAFWLWPENPFKYGLVWPQSGEIDLGEWYSAFPDRMIPYIHYFGSTENITNNYCMIDDVTRFHSYVMEWTSDSIRIIYDGQTCLVNHWYPVGMQHPAPFDSPFMISLTQALGIAGNSFDPAITPLPATTEVDYVRIWK